MTGARRFGGGCLIRQGGYRQAGDSGPGQPAGSAAGAASRPGAHPRRGLPARRVPHSPGLGRSR